jgi:hypothetical protein
MAFCLPFWGKVKNEDRESTEAMMIAAAVVEAVRY